MIEASSQNDAKIGVKGFSSAFTLVVMSAKGATDFLTWIVQDPTVLVHVGSADLGDIAASTDYMVKGSGNWVRTGTSLKAARAATGEPVNRVGASIELNNRSGVLTRGYLEVARVLAHELTLHAMAVEVFRERILERDAEVEEEWRDLVSPGGQLSQRNQHDGAAFDLNAHYEPLITRMSGNLKEQGYAGDAATLRKYYEEDVVHLKVEYAKRDLGAEYLKHHLLEGVVF
ncbi:hypothetical protein [Umezawaea tangerina]|uniref:Uncharacterized protein n=1 Tax=Umezawaea tangerina TaxID=84725 RepID=A0A2T0SC17_9PSEU|nr:hypothetical protein [Umezawaea tangerina]PRY30956.1 hypothetical protein CLV43_12358 [Umezawaea tangerina]